MSDRLLEDLTPEEQEQYHQEHEDQISGAIFHATKDLHIMENLKIAIAMYLHKFGRGAISDDLMNLQIKVSNIVDKQKDFIDKI